MKAIRLLNKIKLIRIGILMIAMLIVATSSSFAQQITAPKITGRVTDAADKTGMPGASISIKGTQIGSITDINGNYSLNAPKGSTLVFSMIGYEKQEIIVENQTDLNVSLKILVTSLDEVVVIGYGKTTKKEITGSIATVKEDGFNKGTFNNPIGLLQGKVAGLNIVNSNGADPQAGYDIILRGTNTLTSGQGPLIIIDGIAGADMKNVSPEEVESMDVLKDGSAAAIYGTRGSNGVIIITTKRAKSGQTKVEYTGQFSTQVNPRGVRNLTADEFKSAIETYAPDKAVNLYGANVDWFKEVTRSNPFSHQHNLAISGGSETFSHRTSIFVDQAEGLLKNNQANKYLIKTNITQKALGNILTLEYNLSYAVKEYSPANYDIFYQSFMRNPTSSIYTPSDTLHGGYTYLPGVETRNPVAMLKEKTKTGKSIDANANVRATLRLTNSLNWSNLFSYTHSNWNESSYLTRYYPSRIGAGGVAEIDNGENLDKQYESTLNYSKTFGKHSFQALGGYTYQQLQANSSYMINSGFDFDTYGANNMGAGSALATGTAEMGSYKDESLLISFFGRVIYNYSERFLASASIRREGSSRFGENNKWGWFPSASIGWRINKEEFLKNADWISDLKLRVGYGVTGNQDFDNYKSLVLMSRAGSFYYNGAWINTYQPRQGTNPNPDLRWEKKQEFNAGVDFGILQGRISGAIDYYYRWSTDLLYTYNVSVPPYLTTQLFANVGTVSNRGVELTLNAVPVKLNKFTWTSTFTFSSNVNKLQKFSSADITTSSLEVGWLGGSFPLNSQRLEEGKPLGTFFGPVWQGVDETGHDLFKNQDRAGHVSPEKWEDIGNANPKCMLGWSNTFTYAEWDLNFALRSQIGGKALNMYRLYYENWQSIGTNNIVYTQYANPGFTGLGQYSSKYIESTTFLKMDNIALGYNFKGFTKYISKLRLYASAQNVFCITNYQGLDPEVSLSGLAPGIEYLSYYPKTTTVTLGLNISF